MQSTQRKTAAWKIGVLALGLFACGQPATPPPRLVVLLATCTLRRDFLGPYDASVAYTPRLNELAAGGQVFLRHETEAGQSGTDFATLFTGVQADQHGVFHHPKRLREELQLIGESYAQAGYETWFFNGHRMAAIDLAYGQGIPPERSVDIRGNRKRKLLSVQGGVFPEILEDLGGHPDKQAFVQINFTVTHGPYSKQVSREDVLDFVRAFPAHGRGVTRAELDRWWPVYEEHRLALEWDLEDTAAGLGMSAQDVATLARVLEVTYRAAVRGLDWLVGELIDEIRAAGLWEDTLFCFTADHGETLYREGTPFHWNHGLQLAPEILGVPWILHGPGQGLAPEVHAEVTRSIDVFPTLCGLSGIRTGAQTAGVDLAPVLGGGAAFPALRAFSHTTVVSEQDLETFRDFDGLLRLYPHSDAALCWVRVREGDLVMKMVHTGGEQWSTEAFDLARDPEEKVNLIDSAGQFPPELQGELRGELLRYKALLLQGYERWSESDNVSPEDALDALRELGYAR